MGIKSHIVENNVMSDIDYKLKVMQAYKDGKKIQARRKYTGQPWYNMDVLKWNWAEFEYRIKPESRTFYINRYAGMPVLAAHETLERANKSSFPDRIECIKVVEVLEEFDDNYALSV